MMTNCPVCSSNRAIGKVGSAQYFCYDCCIEFIVRDEATTIFNVESDGTLTQYLEPIDQVM